jgi:hypothetical protein
LAPGDISLKENHIDQMIPGEGGRREVFLLTSLGFFQTVNFNPSKFASYPAVVVLSFPPVKYHHSNGIPRHRFTARVYESGENSFKAKKVVVCDFSFPCLPNLVPKVFHTVVRISHNITQSF